uniref:Uncharacterized protein n=1 Tax=Anguilla anguilla TaxID=7936 RepID=A0A0E9V2B8_ANGAN
MFLNLGDEATAEPSVDVI